MAKKDVGLIFPPLVESCFGSYYPSTAVLSGYLENEEITTSQLNLNEEFADYLLEDRFLINLEKKQPNSTSTNSIIARVLRKQKTKLYDEHGCHLYGIEHRKSPSFLLRQLASSFVVDEKADDLINLIIEKDERIVELNRFFESKVLKEYIENINYLVGITVPMGTQILPTIMLAERIKDINPRLKIIVGGPVISLMDTSSLETILRFCSSIDCAVKYDGEKPLTSLALSAKKGTWFLSDIPNLVYIESNLLKKTNVGIGNSLKTIPPAKYSSKLMEKLGHTYIGIVLTRGCYWGKCSYCDFVELYKGSKKLRMTLVERTVEEMVYQKSLHGNKGFELITESIPPKTAIKLSNLIIERDLNIEWNSFAMVDKGFTKDVLALMNKSGCTHLSVGMESMTDRVLGLVKKSATRETNKNFLKNAYMAGIKLYINIIPDLPTITREEALKGLEILKSYSKYIHSLQIFPFEITASSDIGRRPMEYGLSVENIGGNVGQAQFKNNSLSIQDPAMTKNERNEVIDEYYKLAQEIENREFQKYNDLLLEPNGKRRFRIAKNYLDIKEEKERIVVYNWFINSLFILGVGWREIVKMVACREYISIEDINKIIKNEEGVNNIVKQLHKMGFIMNS